MKPENKKFKLPQRITGSLLCLVLMAHSCPLKAQIITPAASDTAKYISSQSNKLKGFPFPSLKNVAIDENLPIKLSIGGHFREYYQYYKNELWGNIPPTLIDKNGFYWRRFMLSSDWQFGKRVNLLFELKSGLTSSRAGGNRRRIDYNELDVHQLYLQVITWHNAARNLKIKVGRQEYFFGSQRLITIREGPNNRATFNGATITYQKSAYTLATFVAQPIYDNPYVLDDKAITSQTVWGVNLAHRRKDGPNQWELFYYGYSNSNLKLAGDVGKENRHTIGLFWVTNKKGWKLEAEPILQFGRFNAKTILAYSFYGSVQKKLTIAKVELTPSLSFGDFGGNQNSTANTLNTYNPMYPKPAFGLMIPLAPINLLVCNLGFKLSSTDKWQFSADAIFFWRERHADGLYTPFIEQISPADPVNTSYSQFIGINYTSGIDYKMTNYLSFGVLGGYFKTGDYPKETGQGKNTTYLSATIKLIY